ncbi:hypothetical protein [Bacillus chungangensis]|uniref:Aminoglycoside phosphotransferase n=1 Tax=Bacillus chungangensis TaxID=587633 RepID=A0ABT9WSL8_9BACI|nr:hypothetical protein [Bacillus chungangensis]MDQ0175892.1 hypothetical protein [Bacillus chungangensis]
MTIMERVATALEIKKIGRENLTVSFLGEGAWHEAYLFSTNELESTVIRFPKAFSYGKPFTYDESELFAEYDGRGYYYRQANKIRKGICPKFYTYHVDPKHSFTIESYCGDTMSLKTMDHQQAVMLGNQCGEFFREMHETTPNIEGFGFLSWSNGKLQGEIQTDIHQYWKEETEEAWEQFEDLKHSKYAFDASSVMEKIKTITEHRLKTGCTLSLANRDVSPENLIVFQNSLRLIDPLPIIYSGHVFAGNLMNNFRTLFPTYHRSPRYKQHHFHLVKNQLEWFADGFIDGYAQAEMDVRYSVFAEEFLLLLDLAHHHLKLLEEDFTEEVVLRVGNRHAVAERLPIYLRKLEAFNIENGRLLDEN